MMWTTMTKKKNRLQKFYYYIIPFAGIYGLVTSIPNTHHLITSTIKTGGSRETSDGLDNPTLYDYARGRTTTTTTTTTAIFTTNNTNSSVRRNKDNKFWILCTTKKSSLSYGSYKIRCMDWARWIRQCVADVQIVLDVPYEFFFVSQRRNSQYQQYSNIYWDATVLVKTIPKISDNIRGKMGNIFVDLVDEFNVQDERKVPKEVSLILQTKQQGEEMFPNRKWHVVEHWYNSYPDDMLAINTTTGTATSTNGGKTSSSIEPPFVPPIRILPSGITEDNSLLLRSNDATYTKHQHQYRQQQKRLRMLTVWNTLAADTGSGCPSVVNNPNVTYDCIEQEFDILDWYERVVGIEIDFPLYSYIDGSIDDLNLLPPTMRREMNLAKATDQRPWNATTDVEYIMSRDGWGRGMLYYHLFWQYDVLVVPAKNHTQKLKYGNVQRAVSQMRSGVPVLVEVWGPVMEAFVLKYNYTRCAFIQHWPTSGLYIDPQDDNITFWTWDEAVQRVLDPTVRKECQERGLQIVKDYSPSKIGKKFLMAVGYDGNNILC